ncbi:MAG: hypothetical protein JNK64_02005 [Myxococcales bacterium]|nr:hypothetical protein [Myxococcales bacterium]
MIRVARTALLALALAAAAWPRPAAAKSQTSVTYPADRVFAATVRFVRVDLDAKLLDKDADAGFVLFEWIDDGKPFRSAFEVATTERDGKRVVVITLDIADRPDYLEQVLLDRLRAKLRADLGDEPRPAPPPPPPPAPAPPAPAPADPGTR